MGFELEMMNEYQYLLDSKSSPGAPNTHPVTCWCSHRSLCSRTILADSLATKTDEEIDLNCFRP